MDGSDAVTSVSAEQINEGELSENNVPVDVVCDEHQEPIEQKDEDTEVPSITGCVTETECAKDDLVVEHINPAVEDTAEVQVSSNKSSTEQTGDDDFLGQLLEQAGTKGSALEGGPSEQDGTDSSGGSSSESDSNSEDDSSEEEGSDDENGETVPAEAGDVEEEEQSDEPIKSKNEITDEPAEQLPEGFVIDSDEPIQQIGEIVGFVEKSIIIKSKTSGEFRFLREGSVLCFEDRTPLGYLFEIFGPVSKPMYRVKFNNEAQALQFKDKKKEPVYYVVPKSQFEYTDSIKAIRGTDASNWNDEELPEEEQEFSDDEKEMESKKAKKKKRTKNSKETQSDQVQDSKRKKESNWNPLQIGGSQTLSEQRYHPQKPAFNMGYKSRSEREKGNTQPQVYQTPPVVTAYGTPSSFQPPPAMVHPTAPQMPMFPPFIGAGTQLPFGMAPMNQPNQQMTPQQMQQFQQFQQMLQFQMMQQMMQNGQNNNGPYQNNQQ